MPYRDREKPNSGIITTLRKLYSKCQGGNKESDSYRMFHCFGFENIYPAFRRYSGNISGAADCHLNPRGLRLEN